MLWTTAGWPIWGGCLLMFVAAIIDARTSIAYVLTVPCFLTALVIAILWGYIVRWPSLGGGIDSSLLTAGVTFVVLLVAWLYGFVVAGGEKNADRLCGVARTCCAAMQTSLAFVACTRGVCLSYVLGGCMRGKMDSPRK